MTRSKFTPVGEVLPAVLRSLGLERKFRELRLLEAWPEVVGPEIEARTRPTRVESGVLYVHVDHGAWMQELHFIEKDLIGRLRARVPGVALEKIRFSAKEDA
jgi:predicted nucleic acid-binding Zn ribbon protein